MVSPSASWLALPSRVTTDPVATFWSVPASAVGVELAVAAKMVTIAGALSTVPSLTTSSATYSPSTSTVNVGLNTVVSDSVAALPAGDDVKVHEYVRGSLFKSLLWLPFRVTTDPVATF